MTPEPESWKGVIVQIAHDYKTVVYGFLVGWHMKRPSWVGFLSAKLFKKGNSDE